MPTSGAPKWCIQTRLTSTRAVSGLSRSSDRAGQLEPAAAVAGTACGRRPRATARNRRGTAAPGLFGLPRTEDLRARSGVGRSSRTIARGGAPGPVARQVSTALFELLELRLRRPVGQERQVVDRVRRHVRAGRRGRGRPGGAPRRPGRAGAVGVRPVQRGRGGRLLPDAARPR